MKYANESIDWAQASYPLSSYPHGHRAIAAAVGCKAIILKSLHVKGSKHREFFDSARKILLHSYQDDPKNKEITNLEIEYNEA